MAAPQEEAIERTDDMTKKRKPPAPRNPVSARTEINWRNEDVTRRLLRDLTSKVSALSTRVDKIAFYVWGTGARRQRQQRKRK